MAGTDAKHVVHPNAAMREAVPDQLVEHVGGGAEHKGEQLGLRQGRGAPDSAGPGGRGR
jgi:hypothetical protein